ncbi:MAG: hypothetical protein KF718_19720 [Polyangiaceae bacterium]|nr:hypothetical protein [Polyangiaceae bacterium]
MASIVGDCHVQGMRHASLSWTLLLGTLAACGGHATTDDLSEPGAGAAGAPAAGAGGGAGAGIRPSAGGAPGERETCTPLPDPPFEMQECYDISALRVTLKDTAPILVAAGQSVDITVTLSETSGLSYMYYPGVLGTSTAPGVSVTEAWWLYGIFGCEDYDMPLTITVAEGVAPGTKAFVTAHAGTLGESCEPGHAISIPILVL